MEARIAKLEVFVETFREELDRLHRGQEQLHNEILMLRDHTDRGLAELRKELNTTTRWLSGLIFANMTLTLGLIAKVWGLH